MKGVHQVYTFLPRLSLISMTLSIEKKPTDLFDIFNLIQIDLKYRQYSTLLYTDSILHTEHQISGAVQQ